MATDDFSLPPGVTTSQQSVIIPPPLAGQPNQTIIQTQQPGLSTDKIEVGNTSSAAIQDAEAGLIDKTAQNLDFENKMTERKQRLEEQRFKLDEKKAIFEMKIEQQREDFLEKQARLDRETISNEKGEHWIQKYWRPTMGWLYMAICAMDFIIFPIGSMLLPIITGKPFTPWTSITLQQGGMLHIAFGTILGVTAYTRGIQKQPGLPSLPTQSAITSKSPYNASGLPGSR